MYMSFGIYAIWRSMWPRSKSTKETCSGQKTNPILFVSLVTCTESFRMCLLKSVMLDIICDLTSPGYYTKMMFQDPVVWIWSLFYSAANGISTSLCNSFLSNLRA
ncbi:hypothetical protein LZ32DRAFT_7236 [Colletotrichum eremochloae]|nr:hypothetical protein LZ32DRAFT_7236 [Colletotrichum eremochloae]